MCVKVPENDNRITDENVQLGSDLLKTFIQIFEAFKQEAELVIGIWINACFKIQNAIIINLGLRDKNCSPTYRAGQRCKQQQSILSL